MGGSTRPRGKSPLFEAVWFEKGPELEPGFKKPLNKVAFFPFRKLAVESCRRMCHLDNMGETLSLHIEISLLGSVL